MQKGKKYLIRLKESYMNTKWVIFIIMFSMLFSASDMGLIFGGSYNNIESDLIKSTDNIGGFSIGLESKFEDNVVAGLTYTSRGCQVDVGQELGFPYHGELDVEANYITTYYQYRFDFKKHFNTQRSAGFRLGGEAGYFYDALFHYKDVTADTLYSETDRIDTDEWKQIFGNRWDYGFLVGFDLTILPSLDIVVNYYYSMRDINEVIEARFRSYGIYGVFRL